MAPTYGIAQGTQEDLISGQGKVRGALMTPGVPYKATVLGSEPEHGELVVEDV